MLPRLLWRAPRPWQLAHLLSTPLRVQLTLGGLCWLVLSGWWWLGWVGAVALRADLHALLMVWGILPPFVAGFLAAVRPRWLDLPVPAPQRWRGWALVHLCGVLGVLFSSRWPMLLGSALVAMTLPLAAWAVDHARAWARSHASDRRHAMLVGLSLLLLAAALGAAALGVVRERGPGLRALTLTAFWGGLLPCFIVALDRMTALVRPWLLPALVASLLRAVAALDPGGHLRPLRWLAAAAVLGMGLALLAAALDAARRPRRHNRMTGWTQVAAAWGAIGLLLEGVGLACWWALASTLAQHLLALGFMGGLWMTMGSRAVAAEIGRAQALDTTEWWLLMLLQGVVLLRLYTAWPAVSMSMGALAAAAFFVLATAWCVHWGRLLGCASLGWRQAALPPA